eukprot:TRINITY_DN49420_c0_g1_i1.p1 TRINITY_DN49420_c0_g1~~TRINITY_DN49420_c0_g1_i1.p1  ORF type:complete len:197 (+),score=30.39 TRINITY_DN49420_c0_g1_i1:81-671(+)
MSAVPEGYQIRLVARNDFQKGIKQTLSQLTAAGNLTESRFLEVFQHRNRLENIYRCFVIEHLESQRIVGSATLMVEAKFLRGGSLVGHVEDVVVDSNHRGKGLAKHLMTKLAEEAKRLGCYKVILDCKKENVPLYEKCGYHVNETQMRLDIADAQPTSLAKHSGSWVFSGNATVERIICFTAGLVTAAVILRAMKK